MPLSMHNIGIGKLLRPLNSNFQLPSSLENSNWNLAASTPLSSRTAAVKRFVAVLGSVHTDINWSSRKTCGLLNYFLVVEVWGLSDKSSSSRAYFIFFINDSRTVQWIRNLGFSYSESTLDNEGSERAQIKWKMYPIFQRTHPLTC